MKTRFNVKNPSIFGKTLYFERFFFVKYGIPEDFARVASPKMMSGCHMLRMNVCDAGRHAGTQIHEKGLTFIRVRAWLVPPRAKRTRQTVCDPETQKGLTYETGKIETSGQTGYAPLFLKKSNSR